MAKDIINMYVAVRSLFSTTGQINTTVFPNRVIKSIKVSISPTATSRRPIPALVQLPSPLTKDRAVEETLESDDVFLFISIFPRGSELMQRRKKHRLSRAN